MYAEHCVLAADSEARTDSMIDIAITIYKRVMQVAELKTIMLVMDDFAGGSPLSSVYKNQEMKSRFHTTTNITWSLTKLFDDMQSGARELGETMTIRQIRSGPTSFTGLARMKRDLKLELLGPQLDRRNLESSAKANLREMFDSVARYREHLQPLPEQPEIDATFLARWPLSAL